MSQEPQLVAAAPEAAKPTAEPRRLVLLLLPVLLLAVGLALGRTLRAGFIELDDGTYVYQNPHVLGGPTPANVVWAFQPHVGYWIPLTWLSYQIDGAFTPQPMRRPDVFLSPQPSAFVFHLSNVLYHAAGTCLLFLFLRRATGRTWPSFVAALLWAVHPLRVESVAWVTERKDVLAGFFVFLSLHLYVGWTRSRSRWTYCACGTAAIFSLMAKPLALTLPCVFLLLDYWPLGRLTSRKEFPRLLLEKVPLFIVVAICAIGTTRGQRYAGWLPLSPTERFCNALASYGLYLWRHVDFHALVPYYPYAAPPVWLVILSAAVLLALTAVTFCYRRSRPACWVGWLWFLGVFMPFNGLFNSGTQANADRFTYFPAVGLAIMIAFALPARWYERPRRALTVVAASVLATVLMVGTFSLAGYWETSVALFERTVALTAENPTSMRSLGVSYLHAGRYDDAITTFAHAQTLDPDSTLPELDIAHAYLGKHQTDEAIAILRLAVARHRDAHDLRLLLGCVYMKANRWNDAIAQFEFILAKQPANAPAQAYLRQARQAHDGP